jgi:putative ABC transport system ATP-binding protein
MSQSNPLLRVVDLTRAVAVDGTDKAIVDQVSYNFEAGQVYNIMGPSGAGKSSLLRLLNRLDEPTAGEVVFDGKPYREFAPCDLRRRIGYLFQVPHMFSGEVAQNIRYGNPDLADDALADLAERVQLSPDMLKRTTDKLSIGEQQRVALARLLATNPSVALLDEPTAALDPARTRSIEKLISTIAAENGVTVIMVSHHPQQAVRMGGEGLLMVAGKLVESGPVRALVETPSTECGRRYQNRELT